MARPEDGHAGRRGRSGDVALARKHKTYIVCPVYRSAKGRRFNSAVLIDRAGKVVCVYDKAYPYWSEFPLRPTTEVGKDVPVHQADFGRVGMAICFDANFPAVWRRLAEKGAELVIWSSAYSAGRQLQAHALNHHYYIVTSTFTRDCQVYDITGERILDERRGSPSVARITLDLDRGIYHTNFNTPKLQKLLKARPGEVKVEKRLPREQWFVLKAVKPGAMPASWPSSTAWRSCERTRCAAAARSTRCEAARSRRPSDEAARREPPAGCGGPRGRRARRRLGLRRAVRTEVRCILSMRA